MYFWLSILLSKIAIGRYAVKDEVMGREIIQFPEKLILLWTNINK